MFSFARRLIICLLPTFPPHISTFPLRFFIQVEIQKLRLYCDPHQSERETACEIYSVVRSMLSPVPTAKVTFCICCMCDNNHYFSGPLSHVLHRMMKGWVHFLTCFLVLSHWGNAKLMISHLIRYLTFQKKVFSFKPQQNLTVKMKFWNAQSVLWSLSSL